MAFTGKFGRSRSTTAASDDSLRPTSSTDRLASIYEGSASAHRPPAVLVVNFDETGPLIRLVSASEGVRGVIVYCSDPDAPAAFSARLTVRR